MTDRLSTFLESLRADVYAEPPTPGHTLLTARMAEEVAKLLQEGATIIDVGCGQGPALDWFTARGFNIMGTSLCDEDIEVCRANGHDVVKCDMHHLEDIPSRIMDCVWARHVLEHSPIPLLALREFHRVLKIGGILYAEQPGPDTACQHDCSNSNHYSVLGGRAWQSLIERSGFEILSGQELHLNTPAGPDVYFSFTAKKL